MTAQDLPFTLYCTPAARGRMLATVIDTDGKAITSENYQPGDGVTRRKIGRLWSQDDRLRNGTPLDALPITRALEAAELKHLADQRDDEAQDDESKPQQAATYIDDGLIAELAWNIEDNCTDFILFDRDTRTVKRAGSINAGTLLVPPNCADVVCTPGGDIPGSVLLPAVADTSCENEDALRDDVRGFINRYVELPGYGLIIAVEYVFLSWVHDAFDELAYMAFRTADLGRGKSRALETIGALCYRPLFCGGGSTAAATLRLLDLFGGTLVADEFDGSNRTELGQEITRIVNQGFQKRRPIVKCVGEDNEPRAFQCFGPKLFALRKRLGDDASESRTISVHMKQRTRPDIPLNLPRKEFDREALTLRNRLLWWRLTYLGDIRIDPDLADAGLEDRANQIGLPLLSVARTAEVRSAIVLALRDQQANTASDRADTLAGEVFKVILSMLAEGKEFRPRDVAAVLNKERAEAAGIEVEKLGRRLLTPHRAGIVLRVDLELARAGKDKHGAYYELTGERLRQLCERFGEDAPEGVRVNSLGVSVSIVTNVTTSSPPATSPEKRRSEAVVADDDVGDVGDVATELPPNVTEPAPDGALKAKAVTSDLPDELRPYADPGDVGTIGHREHLARFRKAEAANETPTPETA